MSSILEQIVDAKKKRLEEAKRKTPYNELLKKVSDLIPVREFDESISGKDRISIIGEIKKASPSKGELVEEFDPCEIAEIYGNNGISAISILTEEDFFKGDLHFLSSAKYVTEIPLLRKDFIFDPYQIVESRVYQADAVLLICRILEQQQLQKLIEEADDFGIECLVEVHDKLDIEKALGAGAKIIGINNRDLTDFTIDINKTVELAASLPSSVIVVSESGFLEPEDIEKVRGCGVDAVLIGESFMMAEDITERVKAFVAESRK